MHKTPFVMLEGLKARDGRTLAFECIAIAEHFDPQREDQPCTPNLSREQADVLYYFRSDLRNRAILCGDDTLTIIGEPFHRIDVGDLSRGGYLLHDADDDADFAVARVIMAKEQGEAPIAEPKATATAQVPSDDRITTAIEEAELAFWAVIAQRFPECKTGDFPPDADFQLSDDLQRAVKVWLSFNHPAFENEAATTVPAATEDAEGFYRVPFTITGWTVMKARWLQEVQDAMEGEHIDERELMSTDASFDIETRVTPGIEPTPYTGDLHPQEGVWNIERAEDGSIESVWFGRDE